jgi:hypothetical protein
LWDAARYTPLFRANLLRDVVLPALEKQEIEWLGYHAFRRGLATNLRALGVDDRTIMENTSAIVIMPTSWQKLTVQGWSR